MARLTPKSVEEAKPVKSRREIPDDGARGLYLVVQPSGKKSWAARYRINGVSKKFTIDTYPKMSLTEARTHVAAIMHHVDRGVDPSTERRAEQEAAKGGLGYVSFNDAFERYKKVRLPKLKSGDQYRKEISRHFLPLYGDRDIRSITRKDIRIVRDDIAEDDHIPTANRATAYVSAFMTWCEDRDLIDLNPVKGIKQLPGEKSRERVLTDDELREFMKACREISGPWGDFAMILLLTGQRLREISMMTTAEVKGDMLTLSSDRTKNGRIHDVPLSPTTLEVLGRRPCNPIPRKKFAYFFTTTHTSPISGFSYGRKVIQKLMPEADHWTYHDLRRTMATRLEGMGVTLEVTEAILNHISGKKSGVAGIYQRYQYAAEKREALDAWAAELERIKNDV